MMNNIHQGGCIDTGIFRRSSPPSLIDIILGNPRPTPPYPIPAPAPTPRRVPPRVSSDDDSDDEAERQRRRARNYQEQLDASKRQLEQLERRNEELLSRFKALEDQLKKARITTFEELAHQDREAKTALIKLAEKTQPMRMQGLNIGLFGLTSTGKSTMINSLLGEQRAATGYSETTLTVTRYRGRGYTLYDFPGRNDDMSYFSLEYISFFKGLTHCLILIQATVRENSSLMRLLDEIGVTYHLVFNKFDLVPAAEQAQVKAQVRSQIQSLSLRGVNKLYFISSLNPRQFPDWLQMVQDLLA